MKEVELTNVMFGRSERAETFVYAFVLTVLFGLLVNFFMRRKLDKILMVESLKSVE
jgi:putative ABC transport system permease protein